jgi:hypothetical protein
VPVISPVECVVVLRRAYDGLACRHKLSVVDKTPLFTIDVVSIPLFLASARLAFALVPPWGRRFPRRLPSERSS